MSTMKAVRIHEYGGPDVLRYEDAPIPALTAGDVLVRVGAAGVNPVDWKVREGYLQKAIRYPLPMIPGWDVSGTVERIGPGADGFAIGDEVYARPDIARNGAYAEYIAVRARELARKPRTLDHVHAAAVPLAALTAWQSLFEAPPPHSAVGLAPGQTILIHGGAGGVGTFAIQLAKWRGARVITTASGRNESLVRDLGADEVIDYTRQAFDEVVRGVDAVLDTVGGETQARSWKVLRPGGVLGSITSHPSKEEAAAHQARAAYVFIQPDASQLTEIARLIDDGTVKVVVSEVLPLAEAAAAHMHSQTGHTRGKIVLDVAGTR